MLIHPDTASDRLANVRARLAWRVTIRRENEARMGRMPEYRCSRTGVVVTARPLTTDGRSTVMYW